MALLLRSSWLHPLNDRAAWSQLLSYFNPLWSLTEARARVLEVIDETPQVRSFWLRPNAQFGGFKAGQNVMVGVEINGSRHYRSYSFSSAPRADGAFRVTVQRQPGGRVSAALHQLKVGDWVHLGDAQGRFAPRTETSPILMVAAGSGITPMLGLLDEMAQMQPQRDVVLLHCVRDAIDEIAHAELTARCAAMPHLKYLLHRSSEHGRLPPAALGELAPDWRNRDALLCGPPSFARAIERFFELHDAQDQLQTEHFGRAPLMVDEHADSQSVSLLSSVQTFTAAAGQSLLEAAEASGLSPLYGCRRGICKTCQCQKRSGVVRNLATGELSGPGTEWIQLCVSSALTPIEISL